MDILDLTVPFSERVVRWPGDPPVNIAPQLQLGRGDVANVSRYCLGSHVGTHVDPPCHFIANGPSVDELPLDVMVGSVYVAGLEHAEGTITEGDLAVAGIPVGASRVLLKTRNSRLWQDPWHQFVPDYVSLGLDGARWLVDRGVHLVGIDYLSIEAFDAPGHPVHHLLLSSAVVVVEGLDLRRPAPGGYYLVCLPLKVRGGDGAPARVILLPAARGKLFRKRAKRGEV